MAGTKITRFLLDAYMGRRTGSFAGKTTASVAPALTLPCMTIMRNVAAATLATMRNDAAAVIGAMTNALPVLSEMRSTAIPASGTMRNDAVAAIGLIQ